jgi:hypothetical protein
MYNKRIVIIITLLISSLLNGQDFFPLKNDHSIIRQYKHYTYYYQWGVGGNGSLDYSYDSTTVIDSMVVENKTFYKFFTDYYYYDRQNQKLYTLFLSQIKLAVDFSAPQGSIDTLYFDNVMHEYESSGIYTDSLYGAERNCFSITYNKVESGPNLGYPRKKWNNKYIFVDSIGLYKKIIKYDVDTNPDIFSKDEKVWKNVIVDLVDQKYSELEAPTLESLTVLSDTKILIRWTSRFIRDAFIIERRTLEESDFYPVATLSGSSLSLIDETVVPGFKYFYRIKTLKSGMTSNPSNSASIINIAHPGILAADTLNLGEIKITWTYASPIYDGFILERRYWLNEKPWQIIWSENEIMDTIAYGVTSYLDTNVSIAPYFSYKLRAFKDSLFSPYTPVLIATPLYAEPAKPMNLKFELISSQQNILSWENNDEFSSYFAIERKELDPPGEFVKLLDHYTLDTTFIDNELSQSNKYAYRVKTLFAHRQSDYSDTIYTFITAIENLDQPISFGLDQNYPNPFNPVTEIAYSIPKTSFVNISVFDVLGNLIATLVDEEKISGNYKVKWHAQDFSSGIYFYRLQSKEFSEAKKMLLIK